jgi:protein-disulfide isomerase
MKLFATAVGLDVEAFNSCFDSGEYASAVRAEKSEGEERGVASTPTLFINGQEMPGNLPFEQYQQLIAAELGQ